MDGVCPDIFMSWPPSWARASSPDTSNDVMAKASKSIPRTDVLLPSEGISTKKHVGTAALGCPAEQRSASLLSAKPLSSHARPDSRGRLSPRVQRGALGFVEKEWFGLGLDAQRSQTRWVGRRGRYLPDDWKHRGQCENTRPLNRSGRSAESSCDAGALCRMAESCPLWQQR